MKQQELVLKPVLRKLISINKQTQDEKHLKDILAIINVKSGMKVLDLGCGSGYLTFPIAKRNENAYVVGLDIVTDTLERNTISMRY